MSRLQRADELDRVVVQHMPASRRRVESLTRPGVVMFASIVI
jgi:hypothetical protein